MGQDGWHDGVYFSFSFSSFFSTVRWWFLPRTNSHVDGAGYIGRALLPRRWEGRSGRQGFASEPTHVFSIFLSLFEQANNPRYPFALQALNRKKLSHFEYLAFVRRFKLWVVNTVDQSILVERKTGFEGSVLIT